MWKKVIVPILIFLILVDLLLVGYLYFPQIGGISQKVTLKSESSKYNIEKSVDFKEYIIFLDNIGFWNKNALSDTNGKRNVTASNLTIILTDKSQAGLPFFTDLTTRNQTYSSFGYKFSDGNAYLYLQIDPQLITRDKRDVISIPNELILQATYLLTNYSTESINDKLYKINNIIISKYSTKKFISITNKKGVLRNIYNFIIPTSYAADCNFWSCGTEIGICKNGAKTMLSCTSDSNCDTKNGYTCEFSCGVPSFEESSIGPSCSTGCPPGRCVIEGSQSCSCTPPTPIPPSPPPPTAPPPTAPPPPPTCTISLSPATTNLTLGGVDGTITATVSCTAPVNDVTFSTSNSGIVSIVSPLTDTTAPYTVTVHGVSTGSVIITGSVSSGGAVRNSATAIVNAIPLTGWFQTKDSDVGSGTNLTAHVPAGLYFGLAPTSYSGYPGVPSYQGATDLTNTLASSLGWLVKNTTTNQRIYNYQAITSLIPADTVINTLPATITSANFNFAGTTASYGYKWYKYSGNGGLPLTINGALNIGTEKVILLVDSANLQINGNINVTDGSGFFMVLVGKTATGTMGNINVAATVGGAIPQANPNLEGIYESDGVFNDTSANTQLWVRGSVVANGGVSLLRDLVAGNATTPAELFEYAPDQILLYPPKLGIRKLNWKEVAP